MSFDVSDPKTRWLGAFYAWSDSGGDLAPVVALLRLAVPLDAALAAVLADILDGAIAPKGSRGGPGRAAQMKRAWVDLLARNRFASALHKLRQEAGSSRPKGRKLRDEAAELAAADLGLTADDVILIVGRSARRIPSFDALVLRKP